MSADLTNPIYDDEDAARKHIEAIRWPEGPVCPHCGSVDNATELKGKSTRPGVWKCRGCRKPFTAMIGTIYERSHIPLHKWLLATHLMASSKKGMSAHQLYRNLGFGSYRTAWFLEHRIREAMREENPAPIGGGGRTIEADETFIGDSGTEFKNGKGWRKKDGVGDMKKIVTLVERGGRAKSLKIDSMKFKDIRKALESAARDSHLITDEAHHYRKVGQEFISHETVQHGAKEFARGEITTNTVEGFFSIFKRGMKGVYQHCGDRHLQRYLDEFDFRYSNRIALGVDDTERARRIVKGGEGKRLMYVQPDSGKAA